MQHCNVRFALNYEVIVAIIVTTMKTKARISIDTYFFLVLNAHISSVC